MLLLLKQEVKSELMQVLLLQEVQIAQFSVASLQLQAAPE